MQYTIDAFDALRRRFNHPHNAKLRMVSWAADPTAPREGIARTVTFAVGTLGSYPSEAADMAPMSESQRYEMVAEMCGRLTPGMPGAGRLVLEVPLFVSKERYSALTTAIRKVVETRIRDVLYRYSQIDGVRVSEWDTTQAETRFGERYRVTESLDCISQFCSLPEDGAVPFVSVGVLTRGRAKNLAVIVDSYWAPACKAFCETLRHCSTHLATMTTGYDPDTYDGPLDRDVLDAVRTSLGYAQADLYNPYAPAADGVAEDAEDSVGCCHGFFRAAGVEYAEAMGKFHRRCVATMVLRIIYEEVSVAHSSCIPNPALFCDTTFVPTLSEPAAHACDNPLLHVADHTAVKLVSRDYLCDCVHTTRRVSEVGGVGRDPFVTFVKGQFLTSEIQAGTAAFSYGDIGRGYFSLCQAGSSIAAELGSDRPRHKPVVDGRYYSSSLEPISSGSTVAADVFLPNWSEPEGVRSRMQELFGLDFERRTIRRSTVEATARDDPLVLPCHPFSECVDYPETRMVLANEDDALHAFHEYVFANGLAHQGTTGADLPHILVTDPIITIYSARSLGHYSLRQLIDMARKRGQSSIYLTNTHISKLWSEGKGRSIPANQENQIKHGEAADRSFVKVSLAKARELIK